MKAMCISKIVVFIIIGFAVFASYSGQWEVFTNKNDVRDIAISGNTLWAATVGGVVAWNLDDNSYKSYTTLDGLISCNINQVTIDKKGRPWVATKDPGGLFLYENNEWKQINIDGADYELKDVTISGLEVDPFGNVWVYIRSYGRYFDFETDTYLWRYDGQTWHKHEGVYGPLTLDLQKNLLAVDSISDLESTTELQFRIVSFNGSVFVSKWRFKLIKGIFWPGLVHIALDSKGNTWFSYYGERNDETIGVVCNNTLYNTLDGLADDNVRSITSDESGAVWCATDGGISKFTGYGWVTYDTADGVASNRVYKVLIGSNNTLYAATSRGISILKSNRFKTLKTINEPLHNNYTDIVVDKRGAVILAGGDHIAMYNDLQWKLNCFQSIRIGSSLEDNHVRHFERKSFFKSKDGTLYAIGNGIKGNEIIKGYILKQVAGGSTFFEAFSYTLAKYNDYRFRSPAVACSGNDFCFWLTNYENHLVLLNKQTTEIFYPLRLGFRGPGVNCMLLDRDGRSVWIGYGGEGIVHFDGDTVKNRITKNDGLPSGKVTAIARDSSENLWFASRARSSRYVGGISVLRNPAVQNSIFRNSLLCTHTTKVTKYLKDSDGKVFGDCNAVSVDKSGMVWTHADSGIARFDGSSWKLFDCTMVSPHFPYSSYSHIIQDESGTVWFGTSGCGLLAYKDDGWRQFTTRDGIPNNNILGLTLDSKDNLWILTENGIAMRKSDETFHNRARRDFVNTGNKHKIKQCGSRFYVSSKDKPELVRYTLFDLRGRVVHKQTIHRRKSFVLPGSNIDFGSGLKILSITTEYNNGSQTKNFLKIGDIR